MLRHSATSSLPAEVEGQVVNRQTGAQNSLGKGNLSKGSEILVACGPRTTLGVLRGLTLRPLSPGTGGASTEDLRALVPQNISMDIATFKTLRKEVLLVGVNRGGDIWRACAWVSPAVTAGPSIGRGLGRGSC